MPPLAAAFLLYFPEDFMKKNYVSKPWAALVLLWLLLGTALPGRAQVYYTLNDGLATTTLDQLRRVNADGTGDALVKDNFVQSAGPALVDLANNRVLVADIRLSQASSSLTNTKIVAVSLAAGNAVTTLLTSSFITGSVSTVVNGLALPEGSLPTVATSVPSSITTTSAVLGGNVSADGGATVTGRGVVYSSTATTPAIGGTGVTQDTNGSGTGSFSETIAGLTASTTYYVRAYATNSAGTSYGAVVSFATTAAPVLANIEGATLTYTAGAPATQITSSLTVSDADSPTLTGGTVRIATGFVSAEDRLIFVNQSGISGSYNTGTGVLTLTGTATLAAYQTGLRSIQYQNIAGVSATAGPRLVSFVLSDGTSTSNTQSRTINVVAQSVTAAPVVTVPGNGSLVATSTPTYSGTAVAGSTVTVFVDGTSIGTTTATAGGAFSLAQPTALAQGSHTVRATAQASGEAVSPNSNTNTFTVDSVPPTVGITSTTAASGGSSSNATFAYTVTFSEAVTGFVAGDVSVTNGVISGFTAVSGTTYTFNVTPAGNGVVNVTVPAAVAQDAAGNANVAGTPAPYAITYSAPTATVVSVTRLTLSPTATAQVSYRVVFSASVSGVTVSNFSVTPTGSVSGAAVSSVSGSGTTYTAVVNTGTGDGTLRLNVANATGISPAVTNTPFTAGEVYTITKSFAAAPQLTIVGTGGTGFDVTAFVDVVQVLSGGSPLANALLNASFESHDPLGNGNYGYNPTGASWTFNAQSGIAESGSAFTPTTPIPNGIAVAFVQSAGGGNGQLQQNLAVPSGSSYQVSFQTSQRVCCSTLDQALNVFLNGVFVGNIQPGSSAYSTFTSATFSVTAPALTASISSTAGASGSTTGTAPIPFTVTFSAGVTGFTASDVVVTNGTLSGFGGSGAT